MGPESRSSKECHPILILPYSAKKIFRSAPQDVDRNEREPGGEVFWLLDFSAERSFLRPAFTSAGAEIGLYPMEWEKGRRFQLQQRNCFRISRNSMQRLAMIIGV